MVLSFQDFPVILPPNILALPFNQDQQHPLYSKMKLLVLHLSEHPPDIQAFHQISQMLCWNPGDQPQGQGHQPVLRRWHSFMTSRNLDPYSIDVTAVLAFLHGTLHNGCLYGGLCVARSA